MKPIFYLPRHDKGFTLLELMIVIAVIGVISAIAAPNVRVAHDNAQRKSAERALIEAVAEARAQAVISRGDFVFVNADMGDKKAFVVRTPKDPNPTKILEYSDKIRVFAATDTGAPVQVTPSASVGAVQTGQNSNFAVTPTGGFMYFKSQKSPNEYVLASKDITFYICGTVVTPVQGIRFKNTAMPTRDTTTFTCPEVNS